MGGKEISVEAFATLLREGFPLEIHNCDLRLMRDRIVIRPTKRDQGA